MKYEYNLILAIQDKNIKVYCKDPLKYFLLKNLNGKAKFFNKNIWYFKFSNNKALALILSTLRDNDFIFSGGSHGWNSSDIFKNLREEGEIDGSAKEITWLGNGEYTLRDI